MKTVKKEVIIKSGQVAGIKGKFASFKL